MLCAEFERNLLDQRGLNAHFVDYILRRSHRQPVDYDLNDLDFSIPYLFWDVPYIYIGDTAAPKNHANAMKC